MKNLRAVFAGLAAIAAGTTSLPAQSIRTITGTRQASGQEELEVKVEFAAGRFTISREQTGALYRAKVVYDEDRFEPVLHYSEEDGRLTVGVSGLKGIKGENRDLSAQSVELQLSPSIPTSLALAFGAAQADLELGGLTLTEARIKTGASQTTVRFSEPNRGQCDQMAVHVGAAEFLTERLGNARCRDMSFVGGATGVTLDLTGDWGELDEVHADVGVGVADLTLILPRSAGIEIDVNRFLASFDNAGLVKRGNRYYTTNYEEAPMKLRLEITAVMGSVKLEWR